MTTSETRQAKKGLPFKDITVEPGDTFWPRMERLMVKYDIDTANVEYASLRETSDQEWASKLYVQYGIGGRFSGIEARVDAGPFFGDLTTPPADRGRDDVPVDACDNGGQNPIRVGTCRRCGRGTV